MGSENTTGSPERKLLLEPCVPVSSEGPSTALVKVKCSKCGKALARKSCSQKACIRCCSDMKCEGHREAREKEAIINGTHEINKIANAKRALTIKPGVFRDPAFKYLGETIVIWNLAEYMANVKWRDEAIRKSLRNMESRKQGMLMDKVLHVRKRQRTEGESFPDSDDGDGRPTIEIGTRRMKEGRKKRFARIMNELYEIMPNER